MQNLVIYRKYRPQKFSDMVGQEHVVRTLQGALSASHVPHAYIFTGSRGTGKTTLARIFAKALNCSARNDKRQTTNDERHEISSSVVSHQSTVNNAEPCGQCQLCEEITAGRSLDLIEIDAASNRGIDEIRELREGIGFSPMHGRYKVYLIDEFHQLTKEAFNALLKTLEEPPAHAIFILATTEIAKVPDTILSRALRFNFRLLTQEEIIGELARIAKKEGMIVDREAIGAIAKSSGGSLRDAETLLEQLLLLGKKEISFEEAKDILGFADLHIALEIADKVLGGDAAGAITSFDKAYGEGEDVEQLLDMLAEWVRKLLLWKLDAKLEKLITSDLAPDHLETLKRHAGLFSLPLLAKIQGLLLDRAIELKRTSFPQLLMELTLVEAGEMAKAEKKSA